jgi:hypothetical protein
MHFYVAMFVRFLSALVEVFERIQILRGTCIWRPGLTAVRFARPFSVSVLANRNNLSQDTVRTIFL